MSSQNVSQAPIQGARNELTAPDNNINGVEISKQNAPLKQIKPNSEIQESRQQSLGRGRDGSHPVKSITPGSIEERDKAEEPSLRGSKTSDAYKNSSDVRPGKLGWKRGG